MRSFLFLALAAVVLWACSKDSKPTVSITAPTDGATIMSSDSLVNIKATIADEDQLHEYSVTLKNTTANAEVFSYSGHSHASTLEIDTTILVKVTTHSDMELTVTASNHGGASTTEKVSFHKHP